MARPAWTDVTTGEVDLDSPGIEDVFTAMKDNPAALRIWPLYHDIADTNHTSTSWATMASIYLPIPDIGDYTGIARLLSLPLDVYVSTNSGEYRLQDNDSTTNGTAITGIVNTSYDGTIATCLLDVHLDWIGTVRQINIQSQIVTSGNVHFKIDKRHDGYLEY